MFRNNLFGSVLVLLLFVLGLSACLWAVRYYFMVREAQNLQIRYQALQTTTTAIQALVAETVEYSRRNPDIDSILHKYNLKARPGTNAPATPRPGR